MLHLFETYCPLDYALWNGSALDAVMRLLGEDTPEVQHHLPRLVQLIEDALTKKEWQDKLHYWAWERLLRFVREEGPGIPEMCRREALRAFIPELQYAPPPHTQPPMELDVAGQLLSLSHSSTFSVTGIDVGGAGVDWAGVDGGGQQGGTTWYYG